MASWLKALYLELRKSPAVSYSGEQFSRQYLRILAWLEEPPAKIRLNAEPHDWGEFFSDRFHYHRKKTEKGMSEGDFLPYVKTGDRPVPKLWNPALDYKVALDSLRSAHNVGSIFRTSDAVGFASVVIGGNTPGKGHSQVEKAAMHCTRWIPQEEAGNLAAQLLADKGRGYRIIGVETALSSKSYLEADWPERAVVVMGNEEYGLSRDCLKVCDRFVHIPMRGHKNSINVANAFAVVAFHIGAQRTADCIGGRNA